jgi:hypothetical protein
VLIQSLLAIALTSAFIAGTRTLRESAKPGPDLARDARRTPWATAVLFVVIATLSVIQILDPALLLLLCRDASLIAAGEWWRLATSVLVQDGGVAGGSFNLLSLLLVGGVAEFLWGTRRWICIVVVGVLLAQTVARTWQPNGAGNSMINFSLAGAVCIACLARCQIRPALVAAFLALGAAGLLCLLRDIHGAAAACGAATGLVFIELDRYRQRQRLARQK